MQKRGQLTIFIIMAIVIVVGLLLVFLVKFSSTETKETPKENVDSSVNAVRSFTEECIISILDKALLNLGYDDVSELEDYLDSNLKYCTNSFTKRDFSDLEITEGEVKSDLTLTSTELTLSVNVDYPLIIKKRGSTERTSDFFINYDLRRSIPLEMTGSVTSGEIEVSSSNMQATLTIPKDVTITTADGSSIDQISIRIRDSSEYGGDIVGFLVYDLQPEGATFNPPLELKIRYDPRLIPAGFSEGSLGIARYDEENNLWKMVPSIIDKENNIITGQISHFSIFTSAFGCQGIENTIHILTDPIYVQGCNKCYEFIEYGKIVYAPQEAKPVIFTRDIWPHPIFSFKYNGPSPNGCKADWWDVGNYEKGVSGCKNNNEGGIKPDKSGEGDCVCKPGNSPCGGINQSECVYTRDCELYTWAYPEVADAGGTGEWKFNFLAEGSCVSDETPTEEMSEEYVKQISMEILAAQVDDEIVELKLNGKDILNGVAISDGGTEENNHLTDMRNDQETPEEDKINSSNIELGASNTIFTKIENKFGACSNLKLLIKFEGGRGKISGLGTICDGTNCERWEDYLPELLGWEGCSGAAWDGKIILGGAPTDYGLGESDALGDWVVSPQDYCEDKTKIPYTEGGDALVSATTTIEGCRQLSTERNGDPQRDCLIKYIKMRMSPSVAMWNSVCGANIDIGCLSHLLDAVEGISPSCLGETPGGVDECIFDKSGAATRCNNEKSYSEYTEDYGLWSGLCNGKVQELGGVGVGCCESTCGAATICDEETPGGKCNTACTELKDVIPTCIENTPSESQCDSEIESGDKFCLGKTFYECKESNDEFSWDITISSSQCENVCTEILTLWRGGEANYNNYDIIVVAELEEDKIKEYLEASFGQGDFSLFKTKPFIGKENLFNIYYVSIASGNYSGTCQKGVSQTLSQNFDKVFNKYNWIDGKIYITQNPLVWQESNYENNYIKISTQCENNNDMDKFSKILVQEFGNMFGGLTDEEVVNEDLNFNSKNCVYIEGINDVINDYNQLQTLKSNWWNSDNNIWKDIYGLSFSYLSLGCKSKYSFRSSINSIMNNPEDISKEDWEENSWYPVNEDYLDQEIAKISKGNFA